MLFRSQLLKEKVQDTKNEISRIEGEIVNAKAKVEAQQTLIKTISDAKTETIRGIQAKIDANNAQVSSTMGEITQLVSEISNLKVGITGKSKLLEDIETAKTVRTKLNQKVDTCGHTAEFFTENDVCPQCSQDIPEDHKSRIIHDQIGRAHV